MAEQKPIRPVTHADGSLITPTSKALRKASKRAGWDREKGRWTNPFLDALDRVRRKF